MKARSVVAVMMLAAAAAAAWSWNNRDSQSRAEPAAIEVKRGELIVSSAHDGRLESRNVVTVMSEFQGTATIVELAPEGSRVRAGELLVRFDATKLTDDLIRLEKEEALARSELDSLLEAKLPLELRELEFKLLEARGQLEAESRYLADSLLLQKDNLISEQEIEQQSLAVDKLKSRVEKLELEYQLTRDHLHPAAVASARTKLHSASQALRQARRQLANSTVIAPVDGVVVYKPLNLGGEFRTVRVGDNLYPNQPFMVLPDMQDLVVYCDIPESELARVGEGDAVNVRPLAYPDLALPGRVEAIGSVAQTLPGRPSWQKFFHVTIGVDELSPAIRPGMSVVAEIVSYYRPDSLLIPRGAVTWNAGKSFGKVREGGAYRTRELTLGMANDQYYEVLSGVDDGDLVLIQ